MDTLKVILAERAYREIEREVSRWYNIGMKETGKPFESAGYLLSAVILQKGMEKSPVELIYASDIETLIITHAVSPPDEVKNCSMGHVDFQRGEESERLVRYEQFYRRQILPLIRRYPLVEIVSHFHSHPGGSKKNSSGDIRALVKNSQEKFSKGFAVSFSFIMSAKKRWRKRLEWELTPYLVDSHGNQARLSYEIVPHDHPSIAFAKSQPYYKSQAGKLWEKAWERSLNQDKTLRWEKDRTFRGWTSYGMRLVKEESIMLIPPFFPDERPQVYYSRDGKAFSRCVSATDLKDVADPRLQDLVSLIYRTNGGDMYG